MDGVRELAKPTTVDHRLGGKGHGEKILDPLAWLTLSWLLLNPTPRLRLGDHEFTELPAPPLC